MIDFLYSWIRDRRFLDCQDYTRIIEKQKEIVLIHKEEFDNSKNDKNLNTIIASANLYALYLFKGGRYDEAVDISNKIVDFCKKNLANHKDIKHELVNSYFIIADKYYKFYQVKDAKKYYNKIIKFIGSDEAYSATKQGQFDLYDAYISALSTDHLDCDNPNDLEKIHNLLMEAHKIALDIVEFYDDDESKRYLMMSYLRLGNFYASKNSPIQSLTLYRQARDLALDIYQRTNNEMDHINLINCDIAPVEIYYGMNNKDDLNAILVKSIERLERMRNEHMFLPTVNLLIVCLSNMCAVKLSEGEHEEAVRYALNTKLLARLAKNTWDCPEQKIIYAKALMQYGSVIEKENFSKTISDIQKASNYIEDLVNRKDLHEASDLYVNANVHLFNIFMEKGIKQEAFEHLLKAIDVQERRSAYFPDLNNLRDSADLYELARNAYFKEKDTKNALEYTEKVMNARKAIMNISRYAFDLFAFTMNLSEIGNMYRLLSEFEVAETYIRKAIQIQKQYLIQSPNDDRFLRAISNSYNYLGLIGQSNKRAELVLEACKEQKDIFARLYKITKDEEFAKLVSELSAILDVKK